MPALNEEKNLAKAVRNAVDAFERLKIDGEIIVVNDGSHDATGAEARKLAEEYSFLRVIDHDSPKGIGRSFWDGVQQAQGDVVTLLPGDGENDGVEILRYLPLMEQVDIVVPFVFNAGSRSLPRQFLSVTYRNIINLSFGTSLNYMNGTVMYRRCILKGMNLVSNGFFYQTELLIRCLRAKYLYAEVPYGLKVRGEGESKAVTWKSLKKTIADFTKIFVAIHFGSQNNELAPHSISLRRRTAFPSRSAQVSGSGLLNLTAAETT